MSLYDVPINSLDGTAGVLADQKGKVTLLVNVASFCGLTPQYEGLEKLYERYGPQGFSVVGIPCNQFGAQEPGSDADIQQFCAATYDVTFPVFGKVEVNGSGSDPLYGYLRAQAPGDFGPADGMLYDHVRSTRPEAIGTDEIKWNFTKFVVDRSGKVAGRYEPTVTPEDLRSDLDALLAV
jgi:glutathione peroxidase